MQCAFKYAMTIYIYITVYPRIEASVRACIASAKASVRSRISPGSIASNARGPVL